MRAAASVLTVATAISVAVVVAYPGNLGYDEPAHRVRRTARASRADPGSRTVVRVPQRAFYAVAGGIEAITHSWDVARGLNVLCSWALRRLGPI